MSQKPSVIKQSYKPLMGLLESNLGSTVSELMPKILAVVTTKRARNKPLYIYSEATGEHVATLCTYHNMFEFVGTGAGEAEFSNKLGSPTGLGTICKLGSSQYAGQVREHRRQSDELMQGMLADPPLFTREAAEREMANIEFNRRVVIPREEAIGYASFEELQLGFGASLTHFKKEAPAEPGQTV